jgi:alpha-L-fucosidase
MKYSVFLIVVSIFVFSTCAVKTYKQRVLPTKEQVEWADAEIGVLIHFDMPVFMPDYDWRRDMGKHPDASVFNPTELNTDHWIEAAKASGARYAILVAKHCSGFSLWPTKAHEYSVKNSPWKNGQGDLVKDFIF